MTRSFTLLGLLLVLLVLGATNAQAGIWRHHRYNQPVAVQQPAVVQQPAAHAPAATQAPRAATVWPQSKPAANRAANVWPGYPNYGNPVGSAYSAAAGLRPGQFFGTFGLRPADARARGAY